ncbi:hypothetical protein C8R44DRAFT_728889 [Mycena epipterygia]|nr:hypothetical protein C8R44DRAFT_728889 [Mycena epipterygia]
MFEYLFGAQKGPLNLRGCRADAALPTASMRAGAASTQPPPRQCRVGNTPQPNILGIPCLNEHHINDHRYQSALQLKSSKKLFGMGWDRILLTSEGTEANKILGWAISHGSKSQYQFPVGSFPWDESSENDRGSPYYLNAGVLVPRTWHTSPVVAIEASPGN